MKLMKFNEKDIVQGLKPVFCGVHAPGPFEALGELKPRPPKENFNSLLIL
jgi:hypothetical protein